MDYKFKNPIKDYKAEQKFIRKFLLIFLFIDILIVAWNVVPFIIEAHTKTTETERIIIIVFFIIIIAALFYCKKVVLRKKKLFIHLKHYSGVLQTILFSRKKIPGGGAHPGGILAANIFAIFPFLFILLYIEAANNLRKLIKGKITEEELVEKRIETVKRIGIKDTFDEAKTNYYLHEEE